MLTFQPVWMSKSCILALAYQRDKILRLIEIPTWVPGSVGFRGIATYFANGSATLIITLSNLFSIVQQL